MLTIPAPDPIEHLDQFRQFLQAKTPFCFVRFSDGEIEILRNRYLEIAGGRTVFRGAEFQNNYPDFDSKTFDPRIHQNVRRDLLEAALFRGKTYFKGIPTAHNDALRDREFLLRLNGGFDSNMTFADLFLNSNYRTYRESVVPLFQQYQNIYVIANFRAKLAGILDSAKHIAIPDNFFRSYDQVSVDVFEKLKKSEDGSLILSSASSLSKIMGFWLYKAGKNVTFLDIGTSINDLLSLSHNTRAYHSEEMSWIRRISYRRERGYRIKW